MKLKKYGVISWTELIHLTTIIFRIPFIILSTFTITLFFTTFSIQAAKRETVISILRFFHSKASLSQLQYVLGNSENTYKNWTKKNNLSVMIESLVDDAVIYWIGQKRTDRVVLVIQGGGYVAPLVDFALSFWRNVQLELAKSGCKVGFAVLNYSLIPNAVFPTQIRQASLALEHIIASGVDPSNLHIVSDSAGGHLLLATLSHLLHPLANIRLPPLLTTPIRGIYLMSPWVCLKTTSSSYQSNSNKDILDVSTISISSTIVLADVPKHQINYAEPADAPDGWFTGLDRVVDRVLMTAGNDEVLRDDIIRFSKTLSRTLKKQTNYKFVLQEKGVHDDPYIAHLCGQSIDDHKSLSPLIINWLKDGYSIST